MSAAPSLSQGSQTHTAPSMTPTLLAVAAGMALVRFVAGGSRAAATMLAWRSGRREQVDHPLGVQDPGQHAPAAAALSREVACRRKVKMS
jgi:hypothetical protein